MTGEIEKYYRALDLEPGSSLEQVKQAWRELVKVWHPDRFPNDAKLQAKAQERLKDINRAYEALEQYLASGVPPRTNGQTGSTQSSESGNRQRTEEQQSSKKTEPPPHWNQQTTAEPPKSRAGTIIAVLVVLVILIIIIANSGNNNSSPVTYSNAGNGVNPPPSSGVGNLSPPPPVQIYNPPISKALDEKNGFKDFKFGMTPEQAQSILAPTATNTVPGANVTNFIYVGTSANRIGDFSIDSLTVGFFAGHLYRFDLHFSNFPDEILDAFKVNFGEPFDNDTWKRGDQPLHAKAWQGNKVCAAILGMPGLAWDSAVIYDISAYNLEQDYAAKEPERAAVAFGTNGFKTLIMGMKVEDISLDYKIVDEDQSAGTKKIAFGNTDYWKYWQTIGYYPLSSVSAEFFHDKLYRIDLGFDENQAKIFQAFSKRFVRLQDNDTWTRGTTKLKAKSATDGNLFGAILGPDAAYAGNDGWDSIVLFDSTIWNDASQFKKNAPQRAAKDF